MRYDKLFVVFARSARTGASGWTVVDRHGKVAVENPDGSPYHSCSEGEACRLARIHAMDFDVIPGIHTLLNKWVMFDRQRRAG